MTNTCSRSPAQFMVQLTSPPPHGLLIRQRPTLTFPPVLSLHIYYWWLILRIHLHLPSLEVAQPFWRIRARDKPECQYVRARDPETRPFAWRTILPAYYARGDSLLAVYYWSSEPLLLMAPSRSGLRPRRASPLVSRRCVGLQIRDRTQGCWLVNLRHAWRRWI